MNAKTYWANVYEECRRENDFETLLCLQKRVNDFIDEKYGVLRNNKCEWVRRNNVYMFMEIGEVVAELKIKHWKRGTVDRDKLLEELADVLHFLLSMIIDSGIKVESIMNNDTTVCKEDRLCVANKLVELSLAGYFFTEKVCAGDNLAARCEGESLVRKYLSILKALGVGWRELYEKYLEKNRINFERHWHEK